MRGHHAKAYSILFAIVMLILGVVPMTARQSETGKAHGFGSLSLVQSNTLEQEIGTRHGISLANSSQLMSADNAIPVRMYWTDGGTRKIQRANLDGTNVEDLVIYGTTRPLCIALDVDGGKMYWTDNGSDRIRRANLDGSNVENLVTGLDIPVFIALDISSGKMYWTDAGTGKIQRADLDGSNVENLVTGLHTPIGIALEMVPANTVPSATDDVYHTILNTTVSGNVITDDTGNGPDSDGGDGGALAIAGNTIPPSGTLALISNGGFIYTPTINYTGSVTFTYTISDGFNLSEPATVTITVHPSLVLSGMLMGNGTEARLDWNDAGYSGYQLWRSGAPYNGYAWYADVTGVSLVETVAATNYFYGVYGSEGGTLFGPSNRVGMFSFAIVYGEMRSIETGTR